MHRSIRKRSGFSHSQEAEQALDHVFLTAVQAAMFYERLRQNGHVVIFGTPGHFFLKDDEICYSTATDRYKSEDTLTIGSKERIRGDLSQAIRAIRCLNPDCKYEIQAKKEEKVKKSRKPQKTRCPGCGQKMVLPLGMVLSQEETLQNV